MRQQLFRRRAVRSKGLTFAINVSKMIQYDMDSGPASAMREGRDVLGGVTYPTGLWSALIPDDTLKPFSNTSGVYVLAAQPHRKRQILQQLGL